MTNCISCVTSVNKETLKKFPKFISAITVNMANATTPMTPALQIKNMDSPAAVWIGSADEVFDALKVVSFINRNNPDVETEIIAGEKHLSIILNSSRYIGEWINRKLTKTGIARISTDSVLTCCLGKAAFATKI